MLCGDWNGHVGEAAEGYVGVHGGYGLGDRNDEGCRLLEMCDSNALLLLNTCFRREGAGRLIDRENMKA